MQILLTTDYPQHLVRSIEQVDPRVRTVSLTRAEGRLLRGLDPPEGTDAEAVRQALAEKLAETRVLLGWPDMTGEMLAMAPTLDWAHFTGAGVDSFLENAIFRDRTIAITNSRGASAVIMGEYILSTMLMLSFEQARYLQQQAEHRWQRHHPAELYGRTLGIVGLGAIGEEAARRARPFGMRLLAIRRSAVERQPDELVDEILPPSGLGDLLEQSDFVALTVPLTRETRGLIDEAALRRMKRSAYLINVSRGPVIDEGAFVRAVREGWIAGGALDVFDEEPLPPESPLWDLENVIITPHISGASTRHTALAVEIFRDNLRRYLAGQPLRNLVDRGRGY